MTPIFAVVTGATRGIGLAAAAALADRGARVLLVGRDGARVAEALATVSARAMGAGAPVPIAHVTDLTTRVGVTSLVRMLAVAGRPIDVLLNNAGAIYPDREETVDGVERTFALNHLAAFALTLGTMDLLRAAEGARVVTVSSEAHRLARPPFDDWQCARRFTPMLAYARSKLANILFTRELARRMAGTTVTANCFHPGVVRTGFAADSRGLVRWIFKLSRPFMRTAERGAATGVWLATGGVGSASGGYYVDEMPRRISAAARDDQLAASLWTLSEQLTG